MTTNYIQYRLAEVVAKRLPLQLSYRLVQRLSGLFYRRDVEGRRGVRSNLDHIYRHLGIQAGEPAMEQSVRNVFANFGSYLLEFFRFQRSLTQAEISARFMIQGLEHLDHALAQGRGALLLGSHFGNWEMGAAFLSGLGHSLQVVALPMPDPSVNQLFMARRRARGMEIVEGGGAARSCIQLLRRNGIVAVLADRDFSASRSTTPFFGAPARLPLGPLRMAMLAGTPILPGFLIRLPGPRYHFRLWPPLGPFEPSKDLTGPMTQIAACLEAGIAMAPEQWFVFHPFWEVEEDLRRSLQLSENLRRRGSEPSG